MIVLLSLLCAEYGRQVKYTFLDSLFGGVLVSTVTCEECKHVSSQQLLVVMVLC